MAIGYKLLSTNKGKLESFCNNNAYSQEYYLNEPNYPKCGNGPLAVFKTLKEAMSCCEAATGVVIYKVRYTPSKSKKVWFVSQWDQVISSDFESLCISNHYKFENVALATKVELLEEVYYS